MIEAMDGYLQVAGGDAHATPPHVQPTDHAREFNDLMAAWALERGAHIECQLLLDRLRRFLRRSLASEALSDRQSREATHLLMMIDQLAKKAQADDQGPSAAR